MNIPWYILPAIMFGLGLLIGWQGCERKPQIVTQVDTVRTTTIELIDFPPVSIEVPVPYKVTEYIPSEPDPPDFTLDQLRTYIDTVVFDGGGSLGYNITTRGTLQSAIFAPSFERETIRETITIREREKFKPLRGLYLGVTIGGNQNEFGTLAPGAYYVNRKIMLGYNYNFVGGGHNVTFGRKLF